MNTMLTILFAVTLWMCAHVQGQEPFPFHHGFHPEFVNREQRLQHTGSLEIPAGSELYLGGSLNDQFSCEGLKYGYYADDSNGCHVYHVCVPAEDSFKQAQRFSFICGNQSLFNQKDLVCDHASNVDCSTARSFYNVNDRFDEGLNYNRFWQSPDAPFHPRPAVAPVVRTSPVAPVVPTPVDPVLPFVPESHRAPFGHHNGRFFPGQHFPGFRGQFQG